MPNGAANQDGGNATMMQLFALNGITAFFPTAFLFIYKYGQAASHSVADDMLFALQGIGADSAIILIGVSFFLAAAGDVILSRNRPTPWELIVALGVTCALILLLVGTQGNQIRESLENKLSLVRWTIIQATGTMFALFHGAYLKHRCQ